MSSTSNSPLRVGVFLLSEAESNLVRALLRLFNYDDSSRWVFADQAPYDALVVDHARLHAVPAESLPKARRILRLVAESEQKTLPADTMMRPIRSNRFEAWLIQVAEDLAKGGGIAPAPALAGQPVADSAARLAAVPARPPVVTDSDRLKHFMLRRWPPATLLRNDTQRLRIATLLSRRALSLAQLVKLAGQDEDDIMLFLRVLQSAQPLEVLNRDELLIPSPAPPPAEPSIMKRLISGLRRSLRA